MIVALFRSAFRSLYFRKLNSVLSVLGLSIGFSTFIIVSLFIKYELSWDKFNQNYEHIYRIQTYKTVSGELIMQSSAAISEHIKNGYDAIKDQSLVFPDWIQYLSRSKDEMPVEVKGQFADQSSIEIFTYHFTAGNKHQALIEPYSIILSETLAKSFFGSENPLNKTLLLDKKHEVKITGVYRDLPKNAHLRPGYVVSINTLKSIWNNPELFDDWGNTPYYTYILTDENADIGQLGASIKDLMKDKLETDYRQLFLRPLSDLYMYSTNDNYLIVLSLLGIFSILVLVLAAINYMNLSIASGMLRGKEIGVKKIIGSNRRQLILQIFLENSFITLTALFLSVLLVELAISAFNQATDKQMAVSQLLEDKFFVVVLAGILIVSIVSSIYPSWLITSVNSLQLFKSKIFTGKRNQLDLKKYLVGFQFVISIGLITVAILMSRQIQYTYNQDLGFTRDHLLFVEVTTSESDVNFSKLKNQFMSNEGIKSVSQSRGFPTTSSRYTNAPMINREGFPREELIEVRQFWVSTDFVQTLDMEIIQGRNFSVDFPADVNNSCLINETAARHFGWADPIGKYIDNKQLQVVGVFRDILFHDAYNQIKPLVLTLRDDQSSIQGPVFFGFRVKKGEMNSSGDIIEETLKTSFPNDPFEVKQFANHYAHDQIFKVFHSINRIFVFFSIIGVLLSIFGIVGLVNHSLAQRTKEIAIRKVSGCSSIYIFRKLMVEYIIIISVAGIFGSVAARYIFGKMPIYYPIEQRITDYLVGILIALIVSLLAIFYKTLRESTRNPIEALRYE